jgi:predicted ArsR family transcriptional regulator
MNILEKIQNAIQNAPKRFAKAVVYYAERGQLVSAIPQDIANERLVICHHCENYDADKDTCKICGCEMQVKTRLTLYKVLKQHLYKKYP